MAVDAHRYAQAAGPSDMNRLTAEQFVAELASGNFWRRQTARRLLTERREISAAGAIRGLVAAKSEPWAQLNALYTLAALETLTPQDMLTAMSSPDAGVRINGLRLAEPWLDRDRRAVLDRAFALADDDDVTVALQAALTLGESRDGRVVPTLAKLARAGRRCLDGRGDFELRRQTRHAVARRAAAQCRLISAVPVDC